MLAWPAGEATGAGGGGGIGVWPCEACEVGEEATRLGASLRHEPYGPNGPDLVVWPQCKIGLKVSGPWQNFSMRFSVEFWGCLRSLFLICSGVEIICFLN